MSHPPLIMICTVNMQLFRSCDKLSGTGLVDYTCTYTEFERASKEKERKVNGHLETDPRSLSH